MLILVDSFLFYFQMTFEPELKSVLGHPQVFCDLEGHGLIMDVFLMASGGYSMIIRVYTGCL